MAGEQKPGGGRDEGLIAEANQHIQEANSEMRGARDITKITKAVGFAWIKLCEAYQGDVPPEKVEVFRKNLHVLNATMPELLPLVDDIFSLHNRINTKLLAERNKMTGGFLSLAYYATRGTDWQGPGGMGAAFVMLRAGQGFEALRNHAQDEASRKLIQQAYDALMKKIENFNHAMMQRGRTSL